MQAFDTVDWDAIGIAMRSLGFGTNIQRWVSILYNHTYPVKRRIRANGATSEYYFAGRSVAQGCPLSPLLFICVAEALARLSKRNPDIKGIQLGGREFKLSTFADDTLYIIRDAASLRAIWSTLEEFRLMTGLKVNQSKTEGVLMGASRRKPPPEGVSWKGEGEYMVVLGAPIGNAISWSAYWDTLHRKMRVRLSRWSGTLFLKTQGERSRLASSMLLALFWYAAQSICPTPEISLRIQADIKAFTWEKNPRFTRAGDEDRARPHPYMRAGAALLPTREGGIGLQNWEVQVGALQAMWIVRYLSPTSSNWKYILDHWVVGCSPQGRGVLMTSDYDLAREAMPISLDFWREAAQRFAEIAWHCPSLPADGPTALAEPLWNSYRLDIPAKLSKRWRELGYEHVRDLVRAERAQMRSFDDAMTALSEMPGDTEWCSENKKPMNKLWLSIMREPEKERVWKAEWEDLTGSVPAEWWALIWEHLRWKPIEGELVARDPGDWQSPTRAKRNRSRRSVLSEDIVLEAAEVLGVYGIIGAPDPSHPHMTPFIPGRLSIDATFHELPTGHPQAKPMYVPSQELREVRQHKGRVYGLAEAIYPTTLEWTLKDLSDDPPKDECDSESEVKARADSLAMITTSVIAKYFRQFLVERAASEKKWIGVLSLDHLPPWDGIYASFKPGLLTNKQMEYHLKLVRRALYTKSRNKADDNTCDMCKLAIEHQAHLATCPKLSKVWSWVYACFNEVYERQVEVRTYTTILGYELDPKSEHKPKALLPGAAAILHLAWRRVLGADKPPYRR